MVALNQQPVCQDSYANLISTLIATGLFLVSEIMPFIKSTDSNGLIQGILSGLVKRFPMPQTTVVAPPQENSNLV
jgi:hypothetical protein